MEIIRSSTLIAGIVLLVASFRVKAEEKTTYTENVLPVVEANCAKCHNSDKKKADLDLTTFQSALKGSGSGEVVVSGNVDGSKLWKALTHSEEPFMPPNRPKLEQKDLDVFRKWISGGLLETASSKAVAPSAPAFDLALKPGANKKPEGPPPMPQNLKIEPVIHTTHRTAVTGLASSPWAPLLAVAGQREVLLYHSQSNALIGILPFTNGNPVQVGFSASGKLLYAAGGIAAKNGSVVVWDVTSGIQIMNIGGGYDSILACDIRPDQRQVAIGGPSRIVKIVSTSTGEAQFKLKKHTDWVTSVAFSPNGEVLASADRNGGITLWDPENGQELFTLAGHKSSVTALSWRADSHILASSSEDGTIKWWDPKEGKQVKSWTAHGSGTLDVSFANDGKSVSCGRDGAIILWDGRGSRLKAMSNTPELPLRVVFSSDGEQVFASDFSGAVTSWCVKDGKKCGDLDTNPVLVAKSR
jgi:WD40 repeat protein